MESEPGGEQFNLAQLLRIPFQALVTELHERLAAAGYADIRPTHTLVFAFLGPEGMRLSELAERAQLTKQLVNYIVDYLEERKYVERVPDPADRRAKFVRLTERGQQASQAGQQIIQSIEREWTAKIEPQQMCELRSLLERLVNLIGQQRAP